MYHIAICDDDAIFIEYSKKMILKAGLEINEVEFHAYNDSTAFVNALPSIAQIDLLYVDMQMPGLDGYEVAKAFRKEFPLALLIFCSGLCQPTVHNFEYSPFRYLLKEYTDKKMHEEQLFIIQKLKETKVQPHIIGSWHNSTVRLLPSEILYISVGRNCSQIHVNPDIQKYCFEDNLVCKEKLSSLYEILKDYYFEYAHNSYIVNLQYIKRKTPKEIELTDGTILSLARSKEKTFRLAFAKCMANKY